MQRSDKRKMSLPMKILLWVVGILFLLAIIAVIYVSAKIFITGLYAPLFCSLLVGLFKRSKGRYKIISLKEK